MSIEQSEIPTRSSSPSPKKAQTSPILTDLTKQLAYYFSDENLRRDKFFHSRLSQTGWLDFDLLLSCKKVQSMNATVSDLIAASSAAGLIVNDALTAVKRESPLPALAAENSGSAGAPNVGKQHLGGCVVEIADIPQSVNWFAVKAAIEMLTPPTAAESLKVVYATNVDHSTGKCAILLMPFDNDYVFLDALKSIELSRALLASKKADTSGEAHLTEAPVEAADVEAPIMLGVRLLADAELRSTIKRFPAFIVKKREQRAKEATKASAKSIELAGYKFPNVNALKKRVSEILKMRKAGAMLVENSQDFNLVKAVLALHPRKDEKMAGMVGLKVDKAEKGESCCFWVVKEGGVCEDFSVGKCLGTLNDSVAKPVVSEAEATTETVEAAASSELSAVKESA